MHSGPDGIHSQRSYSSDFEEDRPEERYCYGYRGAFERHEVALATNGMNIEY